MPRYSAFMLTARRWLMRGGVSSSCSMLRVAEARLIEVKWISWLHAQNAHAPLQVFSSIPMGTFPLQVHRSKAVLNFPGRKAGQDALPRGKQNLTPST